MSALEYILLMLFIIGLLTCAYYAAICLPVVLEKALPSRYVDPERNYLIPEDGSDRNENNSESLNIANSGKPSQSKLNLNESYPSAPDTSKLQNEGDSFQSGDIASSGDVKKHSLCLQSYEDEEVPQNIRKLERLQQCRAESARTAPDRVSLLQGDDEDGLVVREPSVRSKHTGQPISPANFSPIVIPMTKMGTPSAPSHDERESEVFSSQPMNLSCKPNASSCEQLPSHSVVIVPRPQSVPPAMSMSKTHPPSHIVVTMPQPLMVAPVYDEPSGDEQPVNSLQQYLNAPPTVNVTVQPTEGKQEPEEFDVPSMIRPLSGSPYGWRDSVAEHEQDAGVRQSSSSLEKTKCNQDAEKIHPGAKITESELADVPCNTSVLSDDDPQNFSKYDHDESDSSDPEITEYNFEVPNELMPSANAVLADEIFTTPNVQVLSYASIDEASILETDASASDSIRVQVGDADGGSDTVDRDSNDDQLEEVDDTVPSERKESGLDHQSHSPDLLRRSPDGDSLHSADCEGSASGRSPSASLEASPRKHNETQHNNKLNDDFDTAYKKPAAESAV
ncbi:uncharacterized protein LOC108680354 [Hyalella azteca]|uniref:Uncharacterized protein LOC108680354 n=1 Tax=Hyalella azteca TaxID=294128 RepID=A0A8B7PEV2_HYAAZ|nr:uncharacterized protein LOC108680354 [Hyalella azteca]